MAEYFIARIFSMTIHEDTKWLGILVYKIGHGSVQMRPLSMHIATGTQRILYVCCWVYSVMASYWKSGMKEWRHKKIPPSVICCVFHGLKLKHYSNINLAYEEYEAWIW